MGCYAFCYNSELSPMNTNFDHDNLFIDMSRSPVTYAFRTPEDKMEVISVLWEDSAKNFCWI